MSKQVRLPVECFTYVIFQQPHPTYPHFTGEEPAASGEAGTRACGELQSRLQGRSSPRPPRFSLLPLHFSWRVYLPDLASFCLV